MREDPSTAAPDTPGVSTGGDTRPRPVLASVTVGALETRYARAGRGATTVVIAPALDSLDALQWTEQSIFHSIATSRRVLVASPPTAIASRHGFSRWLTDFLDGIGIARTSIVATAMHALHALHFSLHHGDRVERLMLVGSDSLAPDESVAGCIGDEAMIGVPSVPILLVPGTLHHPSAASRRAISRFLAEQGGDAVG